MNLRSYQKELLDNDNIPEADLIQNLKELKFINTYLGGHDIIKKGLRFFNNNSKKHILEIGSGGGDNLMALKQTFPKHFYTGLDLKNTCVNYAKAQDSDINYIESDFYVYKPTEPYDIIFNSLFCHHFKDDELINMFKWMNQNSKEGFFIGDLHRNLVAYWSIKLLTAVFSKSYLVKNDAPLSVKRGFKKSELEILLKEAGIHNHEIKWCWAFRYLIVVKK